jgi:hypothetical protein
MINYIDKQRVLQKGLHLIQKRLSKQTYKSYKSIFYNIIPNVSDIALTEYRELIQLNKKFSDFFGDDWNIAMKLNHNEYKRVKRLKEKMLDSVLSDNALFLTLTFNSDTIAKTSYLTRRRYVARYLKSQSAFYIANIDFGARNGREHYHAVVVGQNIDYKAWHSLGAIKGLKIAPTRNDTTRVSKYVAKLTNHAIKETTKQFRLIYSR